MWGLSTVRLAGFRGASHFGTVDGVQTESPRLTHLRLTQKNLIARHQLIAAGITRARLRWKLRSRRWRAVLPNVFAMFTGDLAPRQTLIAALLYGGADAQLTGATALAEHGFRNVPKDRFVRILVPRNRNIRSTGFVLVHRTSRPDPDPRHNGLLRFTSPARSVVEAGRRCPDPRQVRALVAEAVQSGRCTVTDLAHELRAGPRAGTALLRRALDEVIAGVRSIAEGDARALLAASRVLPPVLWNPTLLGPSGERLPTPDGWIPDVDLAIEIDSRSYHLSPEDWERTMHRHARLTEAGALVLHFSPRQVREDPDEFVGSVERAYLTRLDSGHRTRIHAIPTQPG